ncbi:unnamed protein product [Brassicogethes aeneus]|uniref:E3 ubiquitin-protein ligase APD1-4 middle domain-containing protein n=1 Tax=Brassicogethes aeneus TaxID=1431903 RepID=A0A9P0FHK5_BRAAE|nr:unnamed protein product [Brassicogethes aeneus]
MATAIANNDKIVYYNAKYLYSSISSINERKKMHGVKRVMVFCLMTVIMPAILITTPLYLKHTVFADVIYRVAESDVLPIEDGISSIFCQGHTLKMNTSFNAFQLKGTPQLSSKRKHIRLKKSMSLPDDTLEYWGFYLLSGALVKLKVCSRFQGSRILVVRGDKKLRTCGLLDHNLKKKGDKFDPEYLQVNITFENKAEILGLVDHNDTNTAEEDLTIEKTDSYIKKRLDKSKRKFQEVPESKHHKRHIHKKLIHQKKVERLRNILDTDSDIPRQKRGTGPFDAHIAHGGNAFNVTNPDGGASSVSSFETDLWACYNGQILVAEGFPPSKQCNNIHYLEKGNHMITTHQVASNGYYYYIFYSDNDLQSNSIHAIFDIYKPTYRYANTSSNECYNQTECHFDLKFMSDEKIIVEVPTRDGIEHEGDDITLLTSTCHPRMVIYMFFPISVLFLILGCAFL